MFHFHQVNCFSHSLRFIPVYRVGSAGCHRTKTAAPGTGISENHEGSSTLSPALTHVRTVTTFADGMQLMRVYQSTNLLIIFTGWQLNTKPVRLFDFSF